MDFSLTRLYVESLQKYEQWLGVTQKVMLYIMAYKVNYDSKTYNIYLFLRKACAVKHKHHKCYIQIHSYRCESNILHVMCYETFYLTQWSAKTNVAKINGLS